MEYTKTVDDLDLSWTHEYRRSISSQTTIARELMETITITCIYVNPRSEIDHILREKHSLVFDASSSGSILPEEAVLQIIQSKKHRSNLRYKLEDIMSHIVTIDPIYLPEYITTNDTSMNNGFTSISVPTSIWIPPSFFIFHPINTIYFVFRQLVRVTAAPALPSILKKSKDATTAPLCIENADSNGTFSHSLIGGLNEKKSKKVTKRVRISSTLPNNTRSITNKLRILDS